MKMQQARTGAISQRLLRDEVLREIEIEIGNSHAFKIIGMTAREWQASRQNSNGLFS